MRPLRDSQWIVYGYYDAALFTNPRPERVRTRLTATFLRKPTPRDIADFRVKLQRIIKDQSYYPTAKWHNARVYVREYVGLKPKRVR